jgi:hypothetical protein
LYVINKRKRRLTINLAQDLIPVFSFGSIPVIGSKAFKKILKEVVSPAVLSFVAGMERESR